MFIFNMKFINKFFFYFLFCPISFVYFLMLKIFSLVFSRCYFNFVNILFLNFLFINNDNNTNTY